jgi:DNA-3-methyladenine glycosylase
MAARRRKRHMREPAAGEFLHGAGSSIVRKVLARKFYNRDPVEVACELLGKWLVRACSGSEDGVAAGRIVEVEAYLSRDDAACHANRGRTKRNATMFGPPGHAYVYSIHARFCVNVVTEPAGAASAVLIRALEPVEGLELMKRRRGLEDLRDLARGPARLCEALGIDKDLDGWDLTRGQRLWIAEGNPQKVNDENILTTGRIGIREGKTLPLRFFVKDNPYVSKPRYGRPMRFRR